MSSGSRISQWFSTYLESPRLPTQLARKYKYRGEALSSAATNIQLRLLMGLKRVINSSARAGFRAQQAPKTVTYRCILLRIDPPMVGNLFLSMLNVVGPATNCLLPGLGVTIGRGSVHCSPIFHSFKVLCHLQASPFVPAFDVERFMILVAVQYSF